MQMSGITIETGVALGDVVDGVGRRHIQWSGEIGFVQSS